MYSDDVAFHAMRSDTRASQHRRCGISDSGPARLSRLVSSRLRWPQPVPRMLLPPRRLSGCCRGAHSRSGPVYRGRRWQPRRARASAGIRLARRADPARWPGTKPPRSQRTLWSVSVPQGWQRTLWSSIVPRSGPQSPLPPLRPRLCSHTKSLRGTTLYMKGQISVVYSACDSNFEHVHL